LRNVTLRFLDVLMITLLMGEAREVKIPPMQYGWS